MRIPKITLPRLALCAAIAIGLLAAIWFVSPAQLPVVLYKIDLVTIGVVLGYWLDRTLFPYARPHVMYGHAYAEEVQSGHCPESRDKRFSGDLAAIRRALIVIACVLGLTLGL